MDRITNQNNAKPHNVMKTRINTIFRNITAVMLSVFLVVGMAGCKKDPTNPNKIPEGPEGPTSGYDVNLAFEGTVTASSYADGEYGNPYLLVDGTLSELNHNFSVLNTPTNEQPWMKIKLNAKQEINEVKMFPKLGGGGIECYPVSFKIEVSADDESWETVVEKSNLTPPSNTNGQSYYFQNKEAEYVRITATEPVFIINEWVPDGVYAFQLAEVEVYLRKTIPELPEDEVTYKDKNLAKGGAASTDAQVQSGKEAAKAVDGTSDSNDNFFGTELKEASYEANLTVELTNKQSINNVTFYPVLSGSGQEQAVAGFPSDFVVEVSVDGDDWITVVSETGFRAPRNGESLIFNFTATESVKYVRLVALEMNPVGDKYALQLREMEISLLTTPAKHEVTAIEDENIAAASKGAFVTSPNTADGTNTVDKLIDGISADGANYFGIPSQSTNYDASFEVELPQAQEINQIKLFPRISGGSQNGFPVDYTVEISVDGRDWTTVKTVTGANPATAQSYYFAPAVEARYVKVAATKLWSTSNEWTEWQEVYAFQMSEIEVYLLSEAPDGTLYDVNLAFGGTAEMDVDANSATQGVEKLIDGNHGTSMFTKVIADDADPSTDASYPVEIIIELINQQPVNEILLYQQQGGTDWEGGIDVSGFPKSFTLSVSTDKAKWTEVTSKTDYPKPAVDSDPQKFTFEEVEAKYVKLYASELNQIVNMYWSRYGLALNEIEVYLRDK